VPAKAATRHGRDLQLRRRLTSAARRCRRWHGVRSARLFSCSWTAAGMEAGGGEVPACGHRAAAEGGWPGELRSCCVVLWPRRRRRSAAATSRDPPLGASLAAALTTTTESPTGAHTRSGPHVFDPTARRDARGGRYLKYRPPPVAAPSTLFVARRPPPAPLLAGVLRRARELMVHPLPSHPFVQDPPSPIRRRQQLAWHTGHGHSRGIETRRRHNP